MFFSLSFFYCTLGFEVYVQIMEKCCVGTYMAMWFAASIPPVTSIWHFSLCYPSPTSPSLCCPSSGPHPSVWCSPLCVYVFSLFNTYLWARTCGVWFSVLCQFAETDGFQIHPCPYKWHKLIIFYGCIVFCGVYVPHFLYSVYHWWAFGFVPRFCYCEQGYNKHTCACVFIIEWFVILWVYTW